MMISSLVVFISLTLLLTMVLSYLFAYIAKKIKRNSYEDEVKKLFYLYWNQSPEDEIYAWYKVRYILQQREAKNYKTDYVERKIAHLNKQKLYGNMSISESGELIDDAAPDSKMA